MKQLVVLTLQQGIINTIYYLFKIVCSQPGVVLADISVFREVKCEILTYLYIVCCWLERDLSHKLGMGG